MIQKHFVTFYSPGTFVSEETTKTIPSWNVALAQRMAHNIVERYNATPYAFVFTTRARGARDLDSKVSKTSPRYFLGGNVETLAEVKARATDADRILISNMECNNIKRIITNTNSWRTTMEFKDGDVFLDWKPKPEKARKVKRG